ncbi:hypothetical protein GCM10010424_73200 [Streptomyces lienomycini]
MHGFVEQCRVFTTRGNRVGKQAVGVGDRDVDLPAAEGGLRRRGFVFDQERGGLFRGRCRAGIGPETGNDRAGGGGERRDADRAAFALTQCRQIRLGGGEVAEEDMCVIHETLPRVGEVQSPGCGGNRAVRGELGQHTESTDIQQERHHLTIKPLLHRYTGLEVAAYAMWTGTALLVPFSPGAVRAVLDAPAGATAALVFLGLLPSAAGFVIWGYAVARLSVTVATAALCLVPAVTLAASYLWLGEQARPIAILGGLITIAGLILLNKRRRSTKHIPAPYPSPTIPSRHHS